MTITARIAAALAAAFVLLAPQAFAQKFLRTQTIPPFDTQAALLATTGYTGWNDGQSVTRLGYFAAGDHGAARYRWSAASSATPDGCAVTNPTANAGVGRLLLQPEQSGVHVQCWGAKGDDTVDDTAALNAAIAAWPSLRVPIMSSTDMIHKTTAGLSNIGVSHEGAVFDFGGAKIKPLTASAINAVSVGGAANNPASPYNGAITATQTKGQKTVTVTNATGLAAGDTIAISSNLSGGTGASTLITRIAPGGVSGNILTIETPLPFPIIIASGSPTVTRLTMAKNITIANLVLDGETSTGSSAQGLVTAVTETIHLINIRGENWDRSTPLDGQGGNPTATALLGSLDLNSTWEQILSTRSGSGGVSSIMLTQSTGTIWRDVISDHDTRFGPQINSSSMGKVYNLRATYAGHGLGGGRGIKFAAAVDYDVFGVSAEDAFWHGVVLSNGTRDSRFYGVRGAGSTQPSVGWLGLWLDAHSLNNVFYGYTFYGNGPSGSGNQILIDALATGNVFYGPTPAPTDISNLGGATFVNDNSPTAHTLPTSTYFTTQSLETPSQTGFSSLAKDGAGVSHNALFYNAGGDLRLEAASAGKSIQFWINNAQEWSVSAAALLPTIDNAEDIGSVTNSVKAIYAYDYFDENGATIFSTANTWTGLNTFASETTISLSDDTAATGPILNLLRISTSPLAGDSIGTIRINGKDSLGNNELYGIITGDILDPTSGSEDGSIKIFTVSAGALAARLDIREGLFTIGATGGDKGVDTINASSLYANGQIIADANGLLRLKGLTVAMLPAAGTAGRIAYVTDALSPAYLATIAGGGAAFATVCDTGSQWVAC